MPGKRAIAPTRIASRNLLGNSYHPRHRQTVARPAFGRAVARFAASAVVLLLAGSHIALNSTYAAATVYSAHTSEAASNDVTDVRTYRAAQTTTVGGIDVYVRPLAARGDSDRASLNFATATTFASVGASAQQFAPGFDPQTTVAGVWVNPNFCGADTQKCPGVARGELTIDFFTARQNPTLNLALLAGNGACAAEPVSAVNLADACNSSRLAAPLSYTMSSAVPGLHITTPGMRFAPQTAGAPFTVSADGTTLTSSAPVTSATCNNSYMPAPTHAVLQKLGEGPVSQVLAVATHSSVPTAPACGSIALQGTASQVTFEVIEALQQVTDPGSHLTHTGAFNPTPYAASGTKNAAGAAAASEYSVGVRAKIMLSLGLAEKMGDAPAAVDGGDAPARHVLTGLALGETANANVAGATQAESPVANTVATNGDGGDAFAGGVEVPGSVTAGQNFELTVPVAGVGAEAATVAGWIDFNGNERFEANERAEAHVAAHSTQVTLRWAVPAAAVTGEQLTRLRVARAASDVATSGGLSSSGEVEDYVAEVVGVGADLGEVPTVKLPGLTAPAAPIVTVPAVPIVTVPVPTAEPLVSPLKPTPQSTPQPNKPVGTPAPGNSGKPATPVKPTAPGKPTEPVKPSTPGKPTASVEPTSPAPSESQRPPVATPAPGPVVVPSVPPAPAVPTASPGAVPSTPPSAPTAKVPGNSPVIAPVIVPATTPFAEPDTTRDPVPNYVAPNNVAPNFVVPNPAAGTAATNPLGSAAGQTPGSGATVTQPNPPTALPAPTSQSVPGSAETQLGAGMNAPQDLPGVALPGLQQPPTSEKAPAASGENQASNPIDARAQNVDLPDVKMPEFGTGNPLLGGAVSPKTTNSTTPQGDLAADQQRPRTKPMTTPEKVVLTSLTTGSILMLGVVIIDSLMFSGSMMRRVTRNR